MGMFFHLLQLEYSECCPNNPKAVTAKQFCIWVGYDLVGRLSGVMDDRGKYIYISPEEMQAVADYIKRQGRVSISHLASMSNQFIDLEPKPHFADGIAVA